MRPMIDRTPKQIPKQVLLYKRPHKYLYEKTHSYFNRFYLFVTKYFCPTQIFAI